MAEEKSSKVGIINICNGYLFPPFTTTEWLEQASTSFKPRDSDVFVISYPKSGTHWLTHITYLLEYKEKASKHIIGTYFVVLDIPQVDGVSPPPEIKDNKIPDLTNMRYPKAFIAGKPDPRLFFSHMPFCYLPKNPASKYMYIYRNPKDALVSMYNFFYGGIHSTFHGTFAEFFDYYIENNCFNYCEHVKEYIGHNKDEANIHILCYEQLHLDFKTQVGQIAKFIGCELTEELFDLIAKETNFESMRENTFINGKKFMKEDAHFMATGKVGNWKGFMTEEQSKKIDEILYSKLGKDFVEKHIIFSLEA